jgi:hypothetical protein
MSLTKGSLVWKAVEIGDNFLAAMDCELFTCARFEAEKALASQGTAIGAFRFERQGFLALLHTGGSVFVEAGFSSLTHDATGCGVAFRQTALIRFLFADAFGQRAAA